MIALFPYVASKLALIAFGLPAAFIPSVRRLDGPSRIAAAFATGTVVLTLHAVLLSVLDIRWSVATIALPLTAFSAVTSLLLARRAKVAVTVGGQAPARDRLFAWTLIALGWIHCAAALIATRATSADYLYFWGPKAVRFGRAGAIDVALLADPFMVHLRGLYPPLVPVVQAWSVIVDGKMRWSLGLVDAAVWLIAGTILLRGIIAAAEGKVTALRVTAFWTVAMSASLVASYSGGNAEAPLVFFASVAAAALFLERAEGGFLVALALIGAVLTKVEGTLLWALLFGGMIAARLIARTRFSWSKLIAATIAPLLAFALWSGFQALNNLSLSDPLRQDVMNLRFDRAGAVAIAILRNLGAGAYGLPWLVPTAVLCLTWRQWRRSFAFLVTSAALLAFYFVYYLHERRTLDVVVFWEIPRITQAGLAFLILGAGVALQAQLSRGSDLPETTRSAASELYDR